MKDTPDELLDIICGDAIWNIPTRDLDLATAVALASTNRQLRRLALPRVYHDIDITTPKQLHDFFLLLKDIPERDELVKSFTLESRAWVEIDAARWGLSCKSIAREVLEIGHKIGHRLDKFSYLVYRRAFGGVAKPEDLAPFVQHTRSISIRYLTAVLGYNFTRTEALLSNAGKVEELVLARDRSIWSVKTGIPDPQPLPSSLKRLTVFRQSKERRTVSYCAVLISKLVALEELNLQDIRFRGSGLGNLTRSFQAAGANLRRLSIGSSSVPSVGEPLYEDWECNVFAIFQSCRRLAALHLKGIVHLRRQLLDNLPRDLEELQYEPVMETDSSSAPAEGDILGAFKAYVTEKNGRLKTVQIAHGLRWITRDMELDVVDCLQTHGVADAKFVLQAPVSWTLAYETPNRPARRKGGNFEYSFPGKRLQFLGPIAVYNVP